MAARPRARKPAAPTTPDPIEIAMEAEAKNTSPDSPARTLLVKQGRLLDRQLVSESLSIGLKVLTGAAGLAVAVMMGFMVWHAGRADGLVIRPFSVPPTLAERGVTGEAIAAQIMDRIGEMAQVARSGEAQRQIAASRDEVSIQIPETGISISQLEQWLRQKLGHERRVTGELMSAPDGSLALASRVGSTALSFQRGPEADLSGLVQRTAEDLYGREQPASYMDYLRRTGRLEELRAFAEAGSKSIDRRTRGRALLVLAGGDLTSDLMQAKRLAETALALDRPNALSNVQGIENTLGHIERRRALVREELALLKDRRAFPDLDPITRQQAIDSNIRSDARDVGDFNLALAIDRRVTQDALLGFGVSYLADVDTVDDLRSLHQLDEARAILARIVPENTRQTYNVRNTAARLDVAAEDWPQAWLNWQESIKGWESRADQGAYLYGNKVPGVRILINLGRLDEARRLVDTTPLDCATCVGVRGELEAAEGNANLADHWFAEASRMMPSLTIPPWRWGDSLLKRGDYARAIVQFQEAARRGPKWADPLEGWGEALLAQGKAKEAIAKFAAAAKFAPNWGRLHLKWGQALARSGKNPEAMAEYRKAAGLFLTPTERAELARLQGAR